MIFPSSERAQPVSQHPTCPAQRTPNSTMSTTSPFFQEWVISPPLEARLLLSGRPFPIRSVHTHYSDTQVKSKTIYLGPRPAGKVKIEARQLSGPSRNYTISWTDFEGKIHPPSGLPIVGLDLGDQDIEDVTPHQIEGMDKGEAGARIHEEARRSPCSPSNGLDVF